MPRQDYEDRVERRRERLEDRAEKQSAEATRRFAEADRMGQMMNGQPVLVGHHSEKRHRRDIDRMWNHGRKGVEAHQASAESERRAAAVGTAGVSSDDPEAVTKLKAKLEGLQARQQHMKDFNKAHRAWKKKPEAPATLKMLAAFTEDQQRQLKEYVPAYSWEPSPYAPYQMQNNGANIKRVQERIKQLEASEAAPPKGPIIGSHGAWKIWEDRDENRLFICHADKPPAEVRQALKRYGFRWNRYAGAWSRLLNASAWANAEYLVEQRLLGT